MATKTSTITLIRQKLQITGTAELLSDTEIGNLVDEAVRKYSRDIPKEVSDQFAGQNEFDYDIENLLSSWVDDFSVITKLEFPVNNQYIELLENEDYKVYEPDTGTYTIDNVTATDLTITLSTAAQAIFFKDGNCIYIEDDDANEVNWVSGDGNTTTGVVTLKNAASNTYDATPLVSRRKVLRFMVDSPSTTDIIRVVYTVQHTLSDSVDTIFPNDYDAVVNYAVHLSALEIAAEFSKKSDSSITADTIDHVEKSKQYQSIAADYLKKYYNHLGISEEGSSAKGASITSDWDLTFQHGTDYLWHPKRWR